MTGSTQSSFEIAVSGAGKPPAKPLKPVSLRLTAEEREQLEQDAGDLTLSAYMRMRLFGDDVPKHRTSGKSPVKDQEAIARVLNELGRLEVAKSLRRVSDALRDGVLAFDEELQADLAKACAAIVEIRCLLITALGLRGGDRS